MHEEELLDFASEEEEPVLKERYVPSFAMGVRGKNMLVLVGKDSGNRFRNSHKFEPEKRNLAEVYLRKMVAEWQARKNAKQAELQKKP